MAVAAQERGLLVGGERLETGERQERPLYAVRETTGERLVVIAA